eukprot:4288343-Amphidinium_carterae.1
MRITSTSYRGVCVTSIGPSDSTCTVLLMQTAQHEISSSLLLMRKALLKRLALVTSSNKLHPNHCPDTNSENSKQTFVLLK